ncbi:ATP-grasp domain-containing protein [Photorhabdus africana]|uniref:ATP-grasp domain-containing protein n=1 Tax=Photorhabdus africana TaxID=3097554 RepID=UPI002B4019C8|nr:ATP-grasp domain-containing protein [Photorhabdus sp. CRI-LC]
MLLLGPTDDYLKKALSCDMEITILTEPWRASAFQHEHARKVLLTCFDDFPALLLAAGDEHLLNAFDFVVSFTEYGMEPAAVIAAILQIPGPSLRCSLICRDKLRTRQAVESTLAGNVLFIKAESPAVVETFILAHHLPVVLKPRFATGSQQVTILRQPGERLPELGEGWMVESFAPGQEYSCETFTIEGQHHLVAVTEKLLGGVSGVVEVGHRVHAGMTKDNALRAWIFTVLDSIGMTSGVGHIEVKREGDTFRLIECHNRPGGDRIWQLAELATGFDMITACIHLFAGSTVQIPIDNGRCAAITYFQFPEGEVNTFWHPFGSPPEWVRWHEWRLSEGMSIPPLTDSFHRHGGFIVDADTLQELNQRISHVLSLTGVS